MAFIANMTQGGITTEQGVNFVTQDIPPPFIPMVRPVVGGFDLNIMVSANAEECKTGKLSAETNAEILRARKVLLGFVASPHSGTPRSNFLWLLRLKFFSNNVVSLHCPPKKPTMVRVTD